VKVSSRARWRLSLPAEKSAADALSRSFPASAAVFVRAEKFDALTSFYCRDAACALICYGQRAAGTEGRAGTGWAEH
jgi:hypothetical protein